MDAWADDQKVGRDGQGTKINFLADPLAILTNALDLRMTHEGPRSLFGQDRCKRFSAFFDQGVLKVLNVAEDVMTDPAGDDFPEKSLADQMIKDISNLQGHTEM